MKKSNIEKLNFPSNFLWGSASASYQIEGAVTQDGKGETSWDEFYKEANLGYNGDNAANHYNHFREDIKLLKEIGQQTYRFSISWARIFPTGFGEINAKGLAFYDELVNLLISNNIEPNITLYHWDMPNELMKSGGWANRKNIDYFIEYASLLFKHFNGRVKLWSTINEPASEVIEGYVQGTHPPCENYNFTEAFQVAHHYNIATAKAVKLFKELEIEGKIGIALNPMPVHPFSDDPLDKLAAKYAYDFYSDWYISPILTGEYPKEMFEFNQKHYSSPVIEEGDLDLLKDNKIDYLGINYYMRRVAQYVDTPSVHMYDKFKFVKVEGGEYTDWDWEIYPQGLTELLEGIVTKYGHHEIMITENGMGFHDEIIPNEIIDDPDRISYIERHIEQIKLCIDKDINITGYYVWSALDLLSWTNGFEKRYGLIAVDFDTMKRSIKRSGYWYKEFIENVTKE